MVSVSNLQCVCVCVCVCGGVVQFVVQNLGVGKPCYVSHGAWPQNTNSITHD